VIDQEDAGGMRAGARTPKELGRLLRGKVVIVGTGNELRGDDGLGPALVRRLRKRLPAPCIDAGTALENHLGPILREEPDTVLLVDAVQLGREPGDYELLDAQALGQQGLSTHDMGLGLALELLKTQVRGEIILLGVQPQQLTLGRGISPGVRRTLRTLERGITEALCQAAPR
jgi:hydrogenase 3 maturation protease